MSQEIYNALVKEFPERYVPLQRVPKELKHPSDKPKSPKKHHDIAFDIKEGDSFTDISGKLREAFDFSYQSASFEGGVFCITREIVGKEEVEDDCDGGSYSRNVYGKDIEIYFRASIENPKIANETREYDDACKRWELQLENYRQRKQDIKEIHNANHKTIAKARREYNEDWVIMGRYLKGKGQPKFLVQKRGRLLAELKRIDSLLEGE